MKCPNIKPLLSEYIDNTLSAHVTWEVDKHLADCNPCTRMLNEMRQTVSLLSAAPRLDVPPDFMAKLQSRIAAVEPAPPRRAWLSGIAEMFRPRVLPAWGAAVAACGLAVIVLLPKASEPGQGAAALDPAMVQAARSHNVELATSNPLGDPAAAALVATEQENEAQ